MDNFTQYLNTLLPLLSQQFTVLWAQAIQRAELIQFVCIALCLFAANQTCRTTAHWHVKWSQTDTFLQRASFSMLWIFFLLCTRALLVRASLPVVYLDIALLVGMMWLVVRGISVLQTKAWIKRTVSLLLLSIPALLLTDRLGVVMDFLQKTSLSIGEINISLWSFAKSIALFALLVWLFVIGLRRLDDYLKRATGVTPSARTLITKLFNITGLIIAFLVAIHAIGIDLTALAVFGGAFGIGVGFGLRTIMANFISGIILLLDKSIKPGDVISVSEPGGTGSTFGVVEHLGSRYIVLRKRDGREVLIPNENLMMMEVTNWSFNNRKIRAALKVGVSYGSDMEQVQKVLQDVAADHPRVMQTPEPKAFIIEFGDSSVVFELRYWIVDPEAGMGNIRSELFMAIWKAFKKYGIEIPFPQRVLHAAPVPAKEAQNNNI